MTFCASHSICSGDYVEKMVLIGRFGGPGDEEVTAVGAHTFDPSDESAEVAQAQED
jgi:hypothetical protein